MVVKGVGGGWWGFGWECWCVLRSVAMDYSLGSMFELLVDGVERFKALVEGGVEWVVLFKFYLLQPRIPPTPPVVFASTFFFFFFNQNLLHMRQMTTKHFKKKKLTSHPSNPLPTCTVQPEGPFHANNAPFHIPL